MSPDVSLPGTLKSALATIAPKEFEAAIEFPSKNYWILEQIALWLTLGHIPNFSHGQFPMADVLQNGEFMIYRSYKTKSVLVHYLRGNEALFLKDSAES